MKFIVIVLGSMFAAGALHTVILNAVEAAILEALRKAKQEGLL